MIGPADERVLYTIPVYYTYTLSPVIGPCCDQASPVSVLRFEFNIIHGSGRALKMGLRSSASVYYIERKPKN